MLPIERFWRYVDTNTGGDCWLWTGRVRSKGYGLFRFDASRSNTRARVAHRWLWEHEIGPVPDGFDLHHRCGERLCVRPSHLELLTKAEHKQRHYDGEPLCRNGLHPKVPGKPCAECRRASARRWARAKGGWQPRVLP